MLLSLFCLNVNHVHKRQVITVLSSRTKTRGWGSVCRGFSLSFRTATHVMAFKHSSLNNVLANTCVTWCRTNEAARQVGPRQLLLQDGDDLFIKVFHGHGGDIPQLLQNLMSSLRGSSGVHIAQDAVNLIYHLTKHGKQLWRSQQQKAVAPLVISVGNQCRQWRNKELMSMNHSEEETSSFLILKTHLQLNLCYAKVCQSVSHYVKHYATFDSQTWCRPTQLQPVFEPEMDVSIVTDRINVESWRKTWTSFRITKTLERITNKCVEWVCCAVNRDGTLWKNVIVLLFNMSGLKPKWARYDIFVIWLHLQVLSLIPFYSTVVITSRALPPPDEQRYVYVYIRQDWCFFCWCCIKVCSFCSS